MKHINAISVDIVVDSDQGIRARKLSVGDDASIESIGAFRERVRKTLDEMTGASESRAFAQELLEALLSLARATGENADDYIEGNLEQRARELGLEPEIDP